MKFLALIIVLCWPVISYGQQRSGERSLRVMTFNIRYDEPRDGVNAWPKRRTRVADVIRFHKADIVGVQEALIGQLRDLETLLPAFSWIGVGRSDGKESGEFSAILYQRSRIQLIETKTFWLSETPDVPGSVGWDAALPRIVTWAKLRDRASKKIFYHFNTHFDHRGEIARRESASIILRKIEEIAGSSPLVLTGDLNIREDTEAYRTLKNGTPKVKLSDARYSSLSGHFGGDSTFNDFKELTPGMRIDYIFVREEIKVREHGILSDQWNGLWASDHLPVLAEIVL